MNVATLRRSWSELWLLVKPSELKMTLLIIANKAVAIYRDMFFVGWLLLLICWAGMYGHQYAYAVTGILTITSLGLIILMLARPSVTKKGLSSIFLPKKIGCLMLLVCVLLLGAYAVHFLPVWLLTLIGLSHNLVLSPLVIILILALLDSYCSVSAQKDGCARAGKIFLYHYPFFIMVYLIAWYLLYPVIAWPLEWIMQMSGLPLPISQLVSLLVWLPWYSSALIYGYIRFVREHMDYYYV